MKILVTGGTGYIGSHTVVELLKREHGVIIIDNLSNSSIGVVDNIQAITGVKPVFEQIDLSHRDQTRDFFRKYSDIDAVIHFAAFKAVGESVADPVKYYRNNLFSLINLLDEMKANSIHNLVFSSSCTVYGQPDKLPVTEEAPVQKAFSPYGNTKKISEEIITDLSKSSDLKSVMLRYFNPIGAHESAMIGELPLGVPDNLMPFITQTAIGKRDVLNVFGSDYNTHDGTAIRDYIHVVDLAEAHVIAIERLVKRLNKTKIEIFNLGTGTGYSVLDVIKSFERTSKKKLEYRFMDRRPGDIEKVWADTTTANNVLGWKATRDLDEMTSSAWKWEQSIAAG